MNYTEFIDRIVECVGKIEGEEADIRITQIIKNNDIKLDGLVVMKKDTQVSPTIYLNEFYEQYMTGRDIDEIVDEIVDIYESNQDGIELTDYDFYSFDKVKDKIIFKLINTEKNVETLKLHPHRSFLDLSVVYYLLLGTDNGINITTMITNAMMNIWNVDEGILFELAYTNTAKRCKPVIMPMIELLSELFIMSGDDTYGDDEVQRILRNEPDIRMYVLTNDCRSFGANMMLYTEYLREFAEKQDMDVYIIPSSIHEVILIPDNGNYDKTNLREMVREVNDTVVSPMEILSDEVYRYDREQNIIERC